MQRYDIAIIGAGVVGAMIARTLSAYKLKICVLEKENDVSMGASKANSAIVHAGFDASVGSLKAKLNVLGSEMMEDVARELGVKYKRVGSLVVGFSDEDKKVLEELLERGIANGVKDLRILNKEELHEIEPSLSDEASSALIAPTGAIICPYGLTIAAIGNAMDNGVELMCNFEVSSITDKGDAYEITSSDNKNISASKVINCAGIYSDKIAAMVGDDTIKITPRRGEYILLDRDCGNFFAHTIFTVPTPLGKGILMSPTADGNLILGPTAENITEKEDRSTTSSGLSAVTAAARRNSPSVPLNKAITSFTGLRAVGNTGDFIIRPFGDKFINVAGIESPGLSAAPAIALYVKDILVELGVELAANESFNPIRKSYHFFKELPEDEKREYIKAHPAFGKIVCRCETISEGEIIDALTRNPRAVDIDGVKRRTRSGMGRCQGGFCMPSVTEIIARENGCPFTSVTKNGSGSVINISKTKGAE